MAKRLSGTTIDRDLSRSQIVPAGEEITGFNQRRFRADVELAAAHSLLVVADLTQTRRLDRWGFLTLFDLHERLRPRLVLVAPDGIRRAIRRLDPLGTLPTFSTVDEFRALQKM